MIHSFLRCRVRCCCGSFSSTCVGLANCPEFTQILMAAWCCLTDDELTSPAQFIEFSHENGRTSFSHAMIKVNLSKVKSQENTHHDHSRLVTCRINLIKDTARRWSPAAHLIPVGADPTIPCPSLHHCHAQILRGHVLLDGAQTAVSFHARHKLMVWELLGAA